MLLAKFAFRYKFSWDPRQLNRIAWSSGVGIALASVKKYGKYGVRLDIYLRQ
jgi:hypothetical protein